MYEFAEEVHREAVVDAAAVEVALSSLRLGRTTGLDGVMAEEWREAGDPLVASVLEYVFSGRLQN